MQACPTNLDPSFDTVPDSHYICDLCGLEGEHYKTLCPDNTDPLSLNQKRKTSTGKISSKRRRSRVPVTPWERDIETRTKPTRRRRSVDTESTDGRLKHDPDLFDGWEKKCHERLNFSDEQTNMMDCNEKNNHLNDRITSVAEFLDQMNSNSDPSGLTTPKSHINLMQVAAKTFDIFGSAHVDSFAHTLSEEWTKLSSNLGVYSEVAEDTSVGRESAGMGTLSKDIQCTDSLLDVGCIKNMHLGSDGEDLVIPPTPGPVYHPFVASMIEKYADMSTVVCLPACRPTALEMWEHRYQRPQFR